MRRRRMWCRSGLWQLSRDGRPPPRASLWYCVHLCINSFALLTESDIIQPQPCAHNQLFCAQCDLHSSASHIRSFPQFAVSFTNSILKFIETSKVLNGFSVPTSYIIWVNSRCLGKNVKNLDVLFIRKLFQFSLPAVGNSTVCFPSILEKEDSS